MSLKLYLVINSFIFVTVVLLFSILISTLTSIVQSDFTFLYLYVYRCISHLFESYYLFCVSSFFIIFNVVTFYFEKIRNLTFVILVSTILAFLLNDYELRVLFVYKSQPINQKFYIYLISYISTVLVWYVMLKKIWKSET